MTSQVNNNMTNRLGKPKRRFTVTEIKLDSTKVILELMKEMSRDELYALAFYADGLCNGYDLANREERQ